MSSNSFESLLRLPNHYYYRLKENLTTVHWRALRYGKCEPRGLSCGSTLNICQDVSKSANLIHVHGFGDSQSHSVVIRNAKSCDGSWLEAVYFIFLILHPNFHELSQSLKVYTLQACSEVLKYGGARLYKSQVWWNIWGIFMIFSPKKLSVHVHPVHPPSYGPG